MGVSFKISRTGTRFKPKPVIPDSNCVKEGTENSLDSSRIPSNNESNGKDEDAVVISGSSLTSGRDHISAEDEVSFILYLYPDRYSIGKASENDNGLHTAFQEGSKLFLPYDRNSEGLFAAIESGRLPGGILDDIPCKYVEGAIICEIRDYRKCMSDTGSNPSINGSPTITKVRLKMSLENVVKDIPLLADDSWTYGDLMEVESRILKALQPKLCLDPTPKLDRLSEKPGSVQLNLGLAGVRKRRLRQMPEVTVISSNRLHGKKICIDRVPENSSYMTVELGPPSGDMMSQHAQDNVVVQGPGNQRNMHDPMQGPPLNVPGASPAGQDIPVSYTENINPAGLPKMESQEGQLSPYSTLNKRARLVSGGPDGAQQQQISSYMDSLQGQDVQWRNQMLQQQNARAIQYTNPGMQKYPQLVGEGVGNQDVVKLEKPDSNLVKSDMQMMETETGHMDPRLPHRLHQQSFMRPAFQQSGWTSLSQQVEKDPRKEDQFQKRKSIQSPRLSAGTVAQATLSTKSADMSCGSMGAQYGAVSSAAPLGTLQRDKSAITSIPAVERTTSMTSSANDSMQPQHQAQLSAKRRSNSFSKNPVSVMSGVGSPASVNTMGGPMNASSPSISTPQQAEQSMIERFAKIEVVAMRHQLNCKKNKVDEYPRKPHTFSKQELLNRLSAAANNEYVKDESCTKPMSQSLVGGNMNVCKIRVLNVQPERTVQGNMIPVSPTVWTRMIMSEKPNDGTVAMHYGDLENTDYLNAEEYLPTLPNTHLADLLAAQFCALMIREGYFVEDHIQPRPPRVTAPPSSSQPNAQGAVHNHNTAPDMQQYSDSGQQTTETKPAISNASMNPNPNLLPNTGMLPPGSTQALQMSQGLVSGVSMAPKQEPTDPQQPLQQQQPQQQLPLQSQSSMMPQQQPHFQRSSLMLPANSMPQLNASFGQNSNLPLGNMGNKPSPLQLLQQQQQQQQQQQPSQMQRRMMMGLGPAMGMANIGNNIGLGGLGNVMGIGGARGMGGTGMSAPISGMGANMGQNPMNISQANAISQHIRAGTLNQQAAIAQRLKMVQQSRVLGATQSGVAGISGAARQMQLGSAGLSMLGQTPNRGSISPMQRTMMGQLGQMGQMGQMGMPKLVTGMNVPMNQQQLHLQQHIQQPQQQQMQQPPPQQIQQQEATSPLQVVVSPQQVGSPSTLSIPQSINQQLTPQQQQASPQQMAQRTPMSPPLSSGPIHPMSAGNPEGCPASPALSSQTLGSVGSITNSPMDLQGVNKSNSVANTQ